MLRLRPYKKSDLNTVSSWFKPCNDVFWGQIEGMDKTPASEDEFDEFCQAVAEDESRYQMVVSDDGDIIGHYVFCCPKNESGFLYIEYIVFDPDRTGHGYGIGAIGLILKYAFEIQKVRKVITNIPKAGITVIKLLRAAGFAETGNVSRHILNGRKTDCIEMELIVDTENRRKEDKVVPEDKLIKDIIDNNRLSYALQPIIDASTGDIFGYEALMRSEYGANVSPMTILEYAGRKKRLYDIEKLTMFNVMNFYSENSEMFLGRKIFINSIPGFQLVEADYLKWRDSYGQYFGNVIVEITENTDFKDQELGDLLSRSASDGFGLAIDDYGTGYSNTASLLKYLPGFLKIDRLLIANIHAENKKQHFVKSLVEFAAANGVKTLAEGVETAAELKAVIEIGVDYIQGYYTAKPSMEIIDAIDPEVRNQIISDSVKGINQDVRKIYTVDKEDELPVMRLALEKYTGILVDRKAFTLVGNNGYSAEMSVKIKDGTKCKLTIRDVFMESIQQLPCIELGSGCELTLVLEGENRLSKFGILVPDSSKLIMEGAGNLQIRSQGVQSYAVGNLPNAGVGDIKWKGTGALDIIIEADDGIGIGGGEFAEGCGISLTSGVVRIEPACGKAIAIGASKGSHDTVIMGCKVHLDVKIDKGIGIGTLNGTQNIRIKDANVNLLCSGTSIAAVGSIEDTSGRISIENSEFGVAANGQQMYLVGAKSGELEIGFTSSAVNLRGEGNSVLALGTGDMKAHISAKQAICNIKLASGNPVVYGAQSDNVNYTGGLQSISVNE